MEVVEVRNAYKQYSSKLETKTVLNGLNMRVQQGSIYAMMGSSGCGKTTLISSLVGVGKLDSGDIKIFGEPLNNRQNMRIGYMPQELALINGFKIREMIWFFGTIYGLNSEKINERYRFLSSLLELPDGDRMIRDCSGGQQRRVSFALTLVHEPELLILDEPTVGVDPLLRSKIWDYLVDLSESRNVTILLSTHYIEEAKQSTKVGIMRNGVQIAEDSPQNILRICETTSMEEAFLRLSQRQEVGSENLAMLANDIELEPLASKDLTSTTQNMQKYSSRLQPTFPKIMHALLTKHYLEAVRNFGIILNSILIPILGCILMFYAVGSPMKNLVVGVVSDEVSFGECFNKSLKTFDLKRFDCTLFKSSCRFIKEFDQSVAKLKFYETFQEAHFDAKKIKIAGFIYFSPNFTRALPLFNDHGVEGDLTDDGNVQIFLDQSTLQITTELTNELYATYKRFMEGIMVDCEKTKEAGSFPMIFKAMYGKIDYNLRTTMNIGIILTVCFISASVISSTSMISERVDGIWNRVIVAGVTPQQFLFSHLIEGMVVVIIQLIENSVYFLVFLLPALSWNAKSLVLLILFLTGTAGVMFGLILSVICDSVGAYLYSSQVFLYPAMFICGIISPIQAMPRFLQYIGYSFPFAFSNIALRNIVFKNATIEDFHVQMALVVLLLWSSLQFALGFCTIKKKSM